MIPLRDSIPRVHPSFAVWTLITVNTGIFLFELTLSSSQTFRFFHLYGFVPARFTNTDWAMLVGYPPGRWLTVLTHAFVHSDWLHFSFNMWSLWIFADNIEDVFGPIRFIVFYLLCGAGAVGLHYFLHMQDTQPVVGASGAIAGVMGAYFLLYPHAKVLLLIPIIIWPLIIEIPAVVYLGAWFGIQFVSGVSSLADSSSGGIAWWAHAGGFIAGVALLPIFLNKKRCYFCYNANGRRIGVEKAP